MKKTLARALILAMVLLTGNAAAASASGKPVYIGFDGEYGIKNSTSAEAIELGIKVAISEINASGGVLGGRPLELVTRDNRSVPARGIANLKKFAAMEDLVAVVGGRFSPVLLQQVDMTHVLGMPLLDVWGAADGITSHKHSPSYTFRLSLKDSWAMPALLKRAKELGAKKVGVIFPNTGWGRSNQKALNTSTADKDSPVISGVQWYNWGEKNMLQYYQTLLNEGADAIMLVANDIEGALLLRQLTENSAVKRIPILSHWGVSGGEMVKLSGPILFEKNFSLIQTFSFMTAQPEALKKFSKTAREQFGITDLIALQSPVGTGHAYDMTHILAMAINQAKTTDRSAIRDALEKLPAYDGLVRYYEQPFTKSNHDALSPEQVFIARYRKDGVILPVDQFKE